MVDEGVKRPAPGRDDIDLDEDVLVAAMLHGTQDTVAVLDDDGTFLRFVCGDGYVGRPAAELLGVRVADVVPAPVAEQIVAAIRRAVVGGPPVSLEHLRPSPAGPRHVRARVVRLRAGRSMAHIRDVTDEVRAEAAAKRMAAKLERTERIVAASTLAASVGHEMNGPLTYVAGNLALALDEVALSSSPRLPKLLRDAQTGAARLLSIVGDLRAMTYDAGGDEVVDLNDVVTSSLRMIDGALRGRAEIALRSSGEALVEGNPHRLGQVVTNVVTNALQAVDAEARGDEAGEVTVTLTARGDAVLLLVEDNGRGVSADEAEQIFDPLFTTKSASGGTGLGLAVAHAVVTAHRGHIEAAPRRPRGTVFTITLPRSKRARRATPSIASTGAVEEPCARVLVVDDDALTLDLVAAILHCHQVTKARGGDDALRALAQGEFDIVLSDVVMPSFDGRRLREAVLALGRPIKFAFFTGDAGAEQLSGAPCLAKPFTPEALRRFVREL